MVAPTPEFTPVQCYIIPGTNERLYVQTNILNVDMQSRTFHAVVTAYTLDKASQTLFNVQEHQGKLQDAPAPLQSLADDIIGGVGSSPPQGNGAAAPDAYQYKDPVPYQAGRVDAPDLTLTPNGTIDGFVQLTPEQLDQAAAGLKKVMEEFTNGLQGHVNAAPDAAPSKT